VIAILEVRMALLSVADAACVRHHLQETSEVVERERLRPSAPHVPSGFIRRVFPIPHGQEANMWATTAQLPRLAKHAELFALNLHPDGKSLIGIGQAQALETAKALLDMHMKKLPRLAQMALEEQAHTNSPKSLL
jgi:hypothetical protein